MSLLFRRELRRLALPAVSLLALGMVLLFMYYGSLVLMGGGSRFQYLDLALWMMAWVTPWLMGATAFGPDHETGAESFLSALPVSRVKLLALRTGSALLWSVAVIVAFGIFFELVNTYVFGHGSGRAVQTSSDPGMLLGAAGVFLAACLAAVATRRTLVAFVTAPLFGLVPLFLIHEILMGFGAPESFQSGGVFGMLPLLALAAGLTYVRTGRQPETRKALRMALAVLVAGIGLMFGVTTVGFAYDRLWHPVDSARLESRSADRRVAVVGGNTFTRWNRDHYLSARHRVFYADDVNRPWELPTGTFPVSLSRSGETLLVLDYVDKRFGLADTTARTIQWGPLAKELAGANPERLHPVFFNGPNYDVEVEPSTSYAQGYAWISELTYGRGPVVIWDQETPYVLPRGAAAYSRWDGETSCPIPEGSRVYASGGSKFLVRYPDGRHVLIDVASGLKTPLQLPQETLEARLSPRGRWLFVFSEDSMEQRLRVAVQDLTQPGGPRRPLDLSVPFWFKTFPKPKDGLTLSTLKIHVDPDEERALFSWTAQVDVNHLREPSEWVARTFLVGLSADRVEPVLNAKAKSPEDVFVEWATWAEGSRQVRTTAGDGTITASGPLKLESPSKIYVDPIIDPILLLDRDDVLTFHGIVNRATGEKQRELDLF